MSRLKILLIAFIAAVLLFLGVGAGAWYYLYGAPEISAAELVPANTLAFATIPNGAVLVEAYETSQAHQLLASPSMKPLHDVFVQTITPQKADLIRSFLPNLSGQSFIAITHFDANHPGDLGLIAAMKPKAGLGDFGAFLDRLKAAYPDLIKSATTGKDSVEGRDYDWIQEQGTSTRLCVANVHGWIVTTWGVAPLQDFIQRLEKHSTSSNLADNANYRASLLRVGDDPMTLAYLNYHDVAEIMQNQVDKTNPAMGALIAARLKDFGGAAASCRIENGQIVDRYSFLLPRQAQLNAGLSADPCPFDTLKFTSRNTRFYWGSSFNWKQYYSNLQEQISAEPNTGRASASNDLVQAWFHQAGLDVQHNFIDAMGSEISVQAEWNDDMSFPEVGFFAKVDKPDDFKPVISAILDAVRKQYATSAVINQISNNGQDFATLNFVPAGALTPTITLDGPYFGLFLTANQAVRSYQRDQTLTLATNDNFKQQIGDQRTGAQQVLYLDSPFMLNRAYKLAQPYISLAGMLNRDVANMMQGHPLPDDLNWLAPMGTWSCIFKNDDSGIQACSVSGVGNQGIFLSLIGGAGLGVAQSYGVLDKATSLFMPNFAAPPASGASPMLPPPAPPPPAPVVPSAPAPAPPSAPPATNVLLNATPPPPASP